MPQQLDRKPSPEETGNYHCPSCGNVEEFIGYDDRGYPGDACTCGRGECVCEVTLSQPFTITWDADGPEVHYDRFEGGGSGAEISLYTSIDCGRCYGRVWSEAA